MGIKLPVEKLRNWAEDTPENPALHDRVGDAWKTISWKEYYSNVEQVAKSLMTLGLEKGDCVIIISNNRVEWLFAQFGIMAAGGIATPSYQTNTPEQLAYIINHSQARFIFAEDAEQYNKLKACRPELKNLEKVILFEDTVSSNDNWTISFDDFIQLGKGQDDNVLKGRLNSIDKDDTAFIIYTSGTTGVPKAVMTTHFHLSHMGETLMKRFVLNESSRTISYLPLSHIAEQIATNNLQMEKGGEVYMCADLLKLKDYLPEVRPNAMLGVPRVWEKFETALKGIINSSTGIKKMLLSWGLKVELAAFDKEQETGKSVTSLKRSLANKLVVNKIKEKLGMDKVQHAFIGAAPSDLGNLRFFASLGIRINEVYGMTETTGIICTTSPQNLAFGTVGKPMDGVELKIAEDGEILARGPAFTKGYLHNKEASEELWEGGWLHTGDVGEIDGNGNLKITDRKKDLIITAGAKNVAPQPLEAMLKRINGISQAVVVGDKRPYLIALLTIDAMVMEGLSKELGITFTNMQELSTNERFENYISEAVSKVNDRIAKFEKIGRFKILEEDFTVEDGQLTPTMKMKRKVVNGMYKKEIDDVYND